MNQLSKKHHKIAFYCTRLEGGIGRNVIRLSRNFSERGMQVQIWTERDEIDFPSEIPEKVEVKSISTTHPIMGVIALIPVLLRFRPNVVFTQNERLTRVLYRTRKIIGVHFAIFACVHNIYSLFYASLSTRKMSKRKRMIHSIYPKLDGVICVSEAVKQDIMEYAKIPGDNLHVIYNPVVDYVFDQLTKARIPQQINKDQPLLLNVGNICEQKNQLLLIKSFLVLREHIECNLVILGKGSVEHLQAALKDSPFKNSVYFVGFHDDPSVFYHHADLFVLTSSYEGFGNVVVEALSYGIPVVSTSSGGPNEILDDPKLGEIVHSQEPKHIAAICEKWLSISIDKAYLRNNVTQRFSVNTIANEYIYCMNQLHRN